MPRACAWTGAARALPRRRHPRSPPRGTPPAAAAGGRGASAARTPHQPQSKIQPNTVVGVAANTGSGQRSGGDLPGGGARRASPPLGFGSRGKEGSGQTLGGGFWGARVDAVWEGKKWKRRRAAAASRDAWGRTDDGATKKGMRRRKWRGFVKYVLQSRIRKDVSGEIFRPSGCKSRETIFRSNS